MQRVRVGLTGLAIVLVLIGLASAIFSAANRDAAITIGASNAMMLSNTTDTGGNAVLEKGKDEPLAEMGVTPSTGATEAVDAGAIARQEAARRAQP